jgi:hypothetical protein
MTAPARFRQADLDRLFKAAKKNGVRVRIEPDGAVEMLTESQALASSAADEIRRKVAARRG